MKASSFRGDVIKEGNVKSWSLLIGLSAILIVSGFFISRALAIAGVNLITPNGGERWKGDQEITWTADCGEIPTVNIYYSTDDFNSSVKIAGNITCSDLSYFWDTTEVGDGIDYRIKVADSNDVAGVYDISDADFTIDNTPPVVTPPAEQTFEATGPLTTPTLVEATATDTVDPAPVITYEPHDFGVGTTEVTWTATDAAGNSATGVSNVIIEDTTEPTIAPHEDITAEATSADGAIVDYTAPDSTDLVDGTLPAECTPASGTLFPIGDTIITCTKTDAHGNAADSTTFTVTVEDTTEPEFDPQDDVTVEAESAAGAIATYSPTASDLVDGEITVICTPLSGELFPLGTTPVVCTATDTALNEATLEFDVIVQDTTPPEIAPHEDITAEATSADGAIVDYTAPDSTDLVDGTLPAECTPASGTLFPIGDTIITCTKTDAHGNAADSTTFTVTVEDTTEPEIVNLTPAHTSVTSDATPLISVNFIENGSGIDMDSIKIKVDGENKTDYAVKTTDGVTYTPVIPLTAGTYEVTVKVSDLTGNQADKASWSFIVNPSITTISASSNKISLTADGLSQAIITAQVLDSNDLVEDAVVNFATTIGTLSDITTSDTNGRATAVLTSNTAGQAVITVSYNSNNGLIQGTANVTFTEVVTDTTAPTAIQYPADNSVDVSIDVYPYIDFSEAMNEDTLINGNIGLKQYNNSEVVTTISVSNEGTRVTLIPDNDLDYDTQYYFFVSAEVEDLAGNPLDSAWTSSNKSSHEFTTAAENISVTSYDISLNEGWNLISLPLIPDSEAIEVVLASVEDNIDVVKYYENGTGWLSYVPGIVESLDTMEDGKGYWVNMLEADVLTVSGKEMPGPADSLPSYPVSEGWNLIGFKSVSPMKSSAYLSGVDYITLYGYDDEYTMIAHPELDIDKNMIPGDGYWLYANSDDDIVPALAD